MAKVNWMLLVPVGVFSAMAGLFAAGMFSERSDDLPSPFVGRPAPALEGEPLGSLPAFARADLEGEVTVVNFWASWCPPCRAEHPALMELAAEGVRLYGVNKSDDPGNALAFLQELGNPFEAVVTDPNGRRSLDWGVVALPETFILDAEGQVVLKFAGPIDGVMETIIRPALAEAAAQP